MYMHAYIHRFISSYYSRFSFVHVCSTFTSCFPEIHLHTEGGGGGGGGGGGVVGII